MHIHLVIVQPENYVHSLGFLDTSDYLQFWLQKQGFRVTLGKNRLRHGAVNVVFGAHLGFHREWLEPKYCAFFFNLEQIGQGGAHISEAYEALLKSGPIIDYHPANVVAYRSDIKSVPIIPFLNAPYLNPDTTEIRLKDRNIDLLFFGSINAERKAFIKRIEKTGLDVAVFDKPTYYHERDEYVRHAKAVINTSFYESARFEQVRAFNVLSQGTAFISYLQPGQKIDEDFRDPVFWIDDKNFNSFFKEEFGKKEWCLSAEQKYFRWRETNPNKAMTNLIDIFQTRWQKYLGLNALINLPKKVVQAQDGRYFQDALNLSPNEIDDADLTIDLCSQINWPWTGVSRWGESIRLDVEQLQKIVIRHAPESEASWQSLCSNAMKLLEVNGHLILELPIEELDLSGPQGPKIKSGKQVLDTYMNKFWRAGNWAYRLAYVQSAYVDTQNQPCAQEHAIGGQFILVKRPTTSQERTAARVSLPNFGRNIR
jgi:hypothetical protein